MKSWISAILVLILGLNLAGCSTMNTPDSNSAKEYIGIISGAILGGLAGSAIAQKGGGRLTVISIGAVVGALVGCGLGMYLHAKEQEKANDLVHKNDNSNNVPKGMQQADSWQHSSSAIETQSLSAGKKESTALKASTQDNNLKNKQVKPEKGTSINDKLLSLWRKLPSIQWFINDVKQEELG